MDTNNYRQVWQVRGGQHKYRGHCCNFVRENENIQRHLPLLPSECEIVILRRRGAINPEDTAMFEDFRVRRGHIQQWLNYLRAHHPTFSNPDIQIDDERIQQLPEDGLVHDQLLNLTTSEIDSEEDQGPPEEGDDQPPANLHSNGFVPDLHILTHEIDQLRNAAHAPPPPDGQLLTMPVVRGTPLSEYGSNIAINAFPTLFPTGKGGFDEPRSKKVSEKQWANYLLQFRGGRFARHPRFRYWALNTIMRHESKKASTWYQTIQRGQNPLTTAEVIPQVQVCSLC
jgi:hypothetical protein